MKYKIIGLDLDDTLLNSQGQISDFTKETLLECEQKGIHVVLASGRPNFGVLKISNMIGLTNNYMLSYNGGQIFKKNETVFSMDITKTQLDMLYDIAVENDTCILTYTNDKIIGYNPNEYTKVEVDLIGLPFEEIDDFKTLPLKSYPKALFTDEPTKIKALQEKLSKLDGLNVDISKPFFLEFVKTGVDKGQSLLRLGEIVNASPDEIVTFGDSYNDISMLKIAGTSVAMENAVQDVKNITTHITDTNDNDGVAKFIRQHIL